MVMLSYWNPSRVLVDPFCGSGTIPIEAALIGRNIAPGMKREFVSQRWDWIDPTLWRQARKETHDLADFTRPIQIQGYDIDEKSVRIAREYAFNALDAHDIHFERRDVADLGSRYHYGCVITNPPYGERMGSEEELERLYRTMADRFFRLDSWSVYVLTAYPALEHIFGKKADRRRKLYNGRIMCQYYQYQGPRPPRRETVGEAEN
jgi:putative N6-adenine-specific DNA methylase